MSKMSNLSLMEQLSQHGVIGINGNTEVCSNKTLWFIEHGTVDVYLQDVHDDQTMGAREFLFSVAEGQLLVFPAIDHHYKNTMVAVPSFDARFRVFERKHLIELLCEPIWHGEVGQLFDALVRSINSGFSSNKPQNCSSVEREKSITSSGQTLNIVSESDLTWVTISSGQASYMTQHAITKFEVYPLPRLAWIELSPESTLEIWSTERLLQHHTVEVVLSGIEVLVTIMFNLAIERREQNKSDELIRLRRKEDLDSKAMSNALRGFASLLGAPTATLKVDENDKILSACRLIGERLGINFKSVPFTLSKLGYNNIVKEIAQVSGVRCRTVALKGDWWRKDNGPLLAFNDNETEVFALLPNRNGGYEAVNSSSGEKVAVTDDFGQTLAPFGYSFYAGLPAKKLTLSDLIKFIFFGVKQDILTVVTIGLASALLAMAIPVASGLLFDSVFPAANHGQMVQIVSMLFIASLVTLMFEATRSLAMLRIEGKTSSNLQAAVWDRVLGLPVPFFRDYSAGDLATRINGINEIQQALSGKVIPTLISSIFSVLNVLLLFYYSVKLALVAIGLLLIAILVNLLLGYFNVRVAHQVAETNGKVTGKVLEFLNGISKLRITGSESRAFAAWATGFSIQKRQSMEAGRLANLSEVFGQVFPVFSSAILFASIAYTVGQSDVTRMSTGDFIAFSSAWTIFLSSTLTLIHTCIELLAVASNYERIRPILETVPEVDQSKTFPDTLTGAIELSNVSFSYVIGSPPVLDGISLSIKAGEFVALVGGSGSGKSTLLRLMLGFEKPCQGGIYYDGLNLSELDLGAVRRQLGVVLQNGRLMQGDIYSNIIGAKVLGIERAWEAARACGLDEDIKAMPMGMHSLVSDGGGTLSGGQRQRLLIARAIVNKPRIIFFDEATSALDNQSQATVSKSLETLQATRVVIAHRLSTVINADRIIVLDKGKIVQCGSYEQLMQQNGLFVELAKRQIA